VKPYILNNFMDKATVSDLYYYLIDQNIWNLNRSSTDSTLGYTFPGMVVFDSLDPNQITLNHQYLFGYFSGLVNVIRTNYEKETGGYIPPIIKRIHLGAKNNNSKTEFHYDTDNSSHVTLLGYIMPSWSQDWGGDVIIENESYPCDPGSFIVFPSNLYHNGLSPSKNTPYWRISLNIVCVASSDEFFRSLNETAKELTNEVGEVYADLKSGGSSSYPARITEVGLYDENGELLALCKPNKPIDKQWFDIIPMNIKIRL